MEGVTVSVDGVKALAICAAWPPRSFMTSVTERFQDILYPRWGMAVPLGWLRVDGALRGLLL
jgi:hypothetical protein